MAIDFKVGTATWDHIHQHLVQGDTEYVPKLSTRVNLAEYADKLHTHAVSLEAWEDGVLVGMINVYLNDPARRTGYITNVSVLKEYVGHGVASTLLWMCLECARELHFDCIKLEVSPTNSRALKLYTKVGFKATGMNGDYLMMTCEIAARD